MTKSCANCLYEPICEKIMNPCAHYRKQIIRCKNCKYYKVYEIFEGKLPLCNRIKTTMAEPVEEDDFCSRAERNEE